MVHNVCAVCRVGSIDPARIGSVEIVVVSVKTRRLSTVCGQQLRPIHARLSDNGRKERRPKSACLRLYESEASIRREVQDTPTATPRCGTDDVVWNCEQLAVGLLTERSGKQLTEPVESGPKCSFHGF
jgi:hypothetical protein